MRIPIYQVDAFATEVFSGNPAAVCLLEYWLEDRVLQSIASENNLSETAFLVHRHDSFEIRWFTPSTEVALCGHATLASGFVIFNCLSWQGESISFHTRKSGRLAVGKRGELLEMDFPARQVKGEASPMGLEVALGVRPKASFITEEDLLVVLDSEAAVRGCKPDFSALEKIDCRGVIITARGEMSDFVSRFFAPRVGILEDPVTGSAHCVLAPFWAGILGKRSLHAFQVSKRGGELFCSHEGDRVKIAGRAVLYLEGNIWI